MRSKIPDVGGKVDGAALLDPARLALELERRAVLLPGVRGARVHADNCGITDVRVLVLPERDIDLTVRELKALAREELGHDLNGTAVTVLRAADPQPERPRRRKLTSITSEHSGNRFKARVALEVKGDMLIGEADSAIGERFERRAVAGAVLDGLRNLVDFPIELDSVDVLERGEDRIAMVLLLRQSDRLVGTALVRSTEQDAIARATMDALNRFIGRSLRLDPH